MSHSKTAWLVTWDKLLSGNVPAPSETVVCILSQRLSVDSVKLVVSSLWNALYPLRLGEKMFYGTDSRGTNALFQYDRSGPYCYGFYYGTKPFLHARKVTELHVKEDEKTCAQTISWREPNRYRLNEQTMEAEIIHEGKRDSFTQYLNRLADSC